MIGTINLYIDNKLSDTWCEASILAAKAQEWGINRAKNIWTWVNVLCSSKLPFHHYSCITASILSNEDISQHIQFALLEKAKTPYICAHDIIEIVQTPIVQEILEHGAMKTTISLQTAQWWLQKLDWCYRQQSNGIYIYVHEREDVFQYHEMFLKCWVEYERWMEMYSNDGEIVAVPQGCAPAGGHCSLILVTHDKSRFHGNDWCKTKWIHPSQKAL